MTLPPHTKYLIVGAGVHGLSTGYHLARELRARGKGSGADILIVDKTGVAAGASGIACGVIRNNYFQPAMRALMAHSVSVWERHPDVLSYHPVGYMQISPEVMHEGVAAIHAQQQAIGYPSVFIEGAAECTTYMKRLFHDWRARGITSVLHEKKGGYANNRASMVGLSRMALAEGVRMATDVRVTGFRQSGGAIAAVDTDHGVVAADYVVLGVGPWIRSVWAMLDLPMTITVVLGGNAHHGVKMWRYLCLQEGTLGVDPNFQQTNDGRMPPVIHVDTDAPLYSDIDGALITDQLWGIYYKPDFMFDGVQGGAAPRPVDNDDAPIDPYGTESPEFVVGEDFVRLWCSALAFCQTRFEHKASLYRREPSGGLGAFTPDNFPVFDVFRQNCYVIADSNHGFKMIGVGELVAKEILGESSAILQPFRFSRYAEGNLHPVSTSPFPWS
ncbi:MAG TPA: FAD-binding oxidoreductase [bacterium]|nr:FAD-binding oxidoreductase [bacterium]